MLNYNSIRGLFDEAQLNILDERVKRRSIGVVIGVISSSVEATEEAAVEDSVYDERRHLLLLLVKFVFLRTSGVRGVCLPRCKKGGGS